MLDWLKEIEMATHLESAIARVISEGKVREDQTIRVDAQNGALSFRAQSRNLLLFFKSLIDLDSCLPQIAGLISREITQSAA